MMHSQNFSNLLVESNLMPVRDQFPDPKSMLNNQLLQTLQYCQRKYHTILPNQPQRVELQRYRQNYHPHQKNPQYKKKNLLDARQNLPLQQTKQQEQFSNNMTQQSSWSCKTFYSVRTRALDKRSKYHGIFMKKKSIRILLDLERQSVFNSQGSNSYFRISLPYFISDQIQEYSANQDEAPFYDTVPQTSVYQAPLLNFTSFIQELAQKTQQKTDDEKLILLQQFKPLINPSYLPVFCSNPSKMRCKFSPIDEALLLQGLQKHTSKSLTSIQKGYLWDKDLKQIKNKYKNSICSNAISNKIKQWKLNQYSYLTKSEVKSLIKGIKWFDKRWKLVSKYFVHNRTPEFLEAEFKKSETLLKKRRKHGVEEVYPEHYSILKHYFHFPQGEPTGQIHKLQKQQIVPKQDLSSQVKNLMQKTQITDHQQLQPEPNQNSIQVDYYLNFQNYQGFDFSNSFLLRSSNFNNIDFNLSMHVPPFDEKSKVKVEEDKKQILENQDSAVSPHFNNDILPEFRLDGYESRSRSRYFINSMNMINSRMFQTMDQGNSRFQDAPIKFEPKIEQQQDVKKKTNLQGLDKWRSILDNFDKFPNNK